jgi:hypothetical protein
MSRFFSSVGNHSTSKNYEVTTMIKSVFAAAAAAPFLATAALAGPYVNVETNAGWTGSDYSGAATDLHVGYEGTTGDVGYYIQGGPQIQTPDSGDTETVFSGKAGASVALTDALGAYGEFSLATGVDGADTGYGGKLGVKYNF